MPVVRAGSVDEAITHAPGSSVNGNGWGKAAPSDPGHAPVRSRPTIRGVFVNSHIEALRRIRGTAGVAELERRVGMPLRFRNGDHVPVKVEVAILEHALDLFYERPVPAAERSYEAGRLHYRNFTTTPWAKALFTLFPRNFRFMVLHSKTVAERVFRGVHIDVLDLGPKALQIQMQNNDYPLDHFRGLFQAWMDDFGYEGTVTAQAMPPDVYAYTVRWK